jgi:methyl-accepting chemotaxis protein
VRIAWWSDRPLKIKLAVLVGVGTLGMVAVAGVGVSALDEAGQRSEQLRQAAGATGAALEADMMHDAVRGDVLQSLLSGSGPLYDVAVSDLAEHSDLLRSTLSQVADAGLAPEVSAAVERVMPSVEAYLASAATIVEAAATNNRTATSLYPQFLTAFSALEDRLPEMGEAISTYAGQVVDDDVAGQRRALLLVLSVGAVAVALLVLIGVGVTRSVVRPLRRLGSVVAALADGDLRGEVGTHGKDDVGRIAAAVDASMADLRTLLATLGGHSTALASATGQLSATTSGVVRLAGDSSAGTSSVSAAASQVSANIGVVAAGSAEMGVAVREIAESASEVSLIAGQAVEAADRTTATVAQLGASSVGIADVVRSITAIAAQTNLLALNATIEAARAGDAGRGFAVVANEVKQLAQETATATQDITARVQAIQADTDGAVEAIAEISSIIARINDAQGSIAAAVEEQTATVAEMDRNVADAAQGAGQIAASIATVAEGSSSTAAGMHDAEQSIEVVARMAAELDESVSRFRW